MCDLPFLAVSSFHKIRRNFKQEFLQSDTVNLTSMGYLMSFVSEIVASRTRGKSTQL